MFKKLLILSILLALIILGILIYVFVPQNYFKTFQAQELNNIENCPFKLKYLESTFGNPEKLTSPTRTSIEFKSKSDNLVLGCYKQDETSLDVSKLFEISYQQDEQQSTNKYGFTLDEINNLSKLDQYKLLTLKTNNCEASKSNLPYINFDLKPLFIEDYLVCKGVDESTTYHFFPNGDNPLINFTTNKPLSQDFFLLKK